MPHDLLLATQVQGLLTKLAYWNGPLDGNLREETFRDALKKFQTDAGLAADGWYGAKSDAVLRHREAQLRKAPSELKQTRRWRLTSYYVAEEGARPGPLTPILDVNGKVIARVTSGDFAAAALEGTIRLRDGRLINVAGANTKAKHDDYAAVFAFAQKNRWIPDKPGYAGLVLDRTNTKVIAVSAFHVVDKVRYGEGFGTLRGMALKPWRTLAADIGYAKYRNVEPLYKGKGGVCPPGTEVFIVEMVGVRCPDGKGGVFTHDGWFVVNDTGGAIYGAHYDMFVGLASLNRPVLHPHIGHVWFRGTDPTTGKAFTSETRVPWNYSYGI